MSNKVKFNIHDCHYAVVTTTGFGTPVAVPGAVSISLEPTGEASPFYADGIVYYKSASNGGYEGDLEVAQLPQSFYTDVFGDTVSTSGLLVEKTGVQAKDFAFGFVIDGDASNNYFWFYNCSCTRPAIASQTNEESVEPQTDTITITCRPDASGNVRVKSTDAVATSVITGWFTQVVEP